MRHVIECPVLVQVADRILSATTQEISLDELLISSDAVPAIGASLGLRLVGLGTILRVRASRGIKLAGEVIDVTSGTFLVRLNCDVAELEGILRRAQLA